MSKNFELRDIIGVQGRPLTTVVRDDEGQAVVEGNKMKTRKATLCDIIDELIINFPRERMTMENITNGVQIKAQRADCNGKLEIKDGQYKWFEDMLKDEAVGPKVFGFNLPAILEAWDGFERKHESGESKPKKK